jgi:hypothetical protein
MVQKNTSSQNKSVNLLDMIPVRAVKWETDENGRIVLLKPKFKLPWLKKHILPRMNRPFYKVKLDEKGSFIWKHCSGDRNVRKLAELQQEHFGKKVEPLLDRLALFLHSLEKNGFITYRS